MVPFDIRMMRLGALLLLAGLLTGVFVMRLAIPSVALTAHLTGMGDGVTLMVVALVWPWLKLSRLWSRIGAALMELSLPGVWLALLLGAALNIGRIAPLAAGPGHDGGGPLWTPVATVILVGSSLLLVAATVILLVGLFRIRAPAIQA
jgi:hydroxylaminobenzene mutase